MIVIHGRTVTNKLNFSSARFICIAQFNTSDNAHTLIQKRCIVIRWHIHQYLPTNLRDLSAIGLPQVLEFGRHLF